MEPFRDSARLVRIANTACPVPASLHEAIDQSRASLLQGLQEQEELNLLRRRPTRPTSLLQRALDDFAKQPANRDIIEASEAWDRKHNACLSHVRSSSHKFVREEHRAFDFDVLAGRTEVFYGSQNSSL